jgi:DNA-binding transcriptional LysR family regulator
VTVSTPRDARLRDLEIRHLAALRAVAEEGTFADAAAVLGFSQAAVSQQIAGLERAVGMSVLDRPGGPRRATLTPAGRIVLRHAERVLDRLGVLGRELDDLESGTGGRLVVGTFQSVSVRLLPTLIAQLRRETPDVGIEIVPGELSPELAELLIEGVVDVTFLDQRVKHRDVVVDVVVHDPYVVVTRPDDPVLGSLRQGGYPVTALGERPILGPEPHHAHGEVEAWLSQRGIIPRYSFRTNDNGSLQAMVAAGLGAALMPLLAVDQTDPGVVVLHSWPKMPPRDVYVARRTGATAVPAADRFAAMAVELGGGRLLELASSGASATRAPR